MNTWNKQQARQIERQARERYGSGWELLSDHQRQNFIEARVLSLLMTQGGEQFIAAQQLVTGVLGEISHEG